jgi:hypothetical protein
VGGGGGGDCDLTSFESGDAVIRVRDNVPWEDRIRITGNEKSQKTQFSKSLYTRFDGTREHYGSSYASSMCLLSIAKSIKDTEGGGSTVEAILLLLAKQQTRSDGGLSS